MKLLKLGNSAQQQRHQPHNWDTTSQPQNLATEQPENSNQATTFEHKPYGDTVILYIISLRQSKSKEQGVSFLENWKPASSKLKREKMNRERRNAQQCHNSTQIFGDASKYVLFLPSEVISSNGRYASLIESLTCEFHFRAHFWMFSQILAHWWDLRPFSPRLPRLMIFVHTYIISSSKLLLLQYFIVKTVTSDFWLIAGSQF